MQFIGDIVAVPAGVFKKATVDGSWYLHLYGLVG